MGWNGSGAVKPVKSGVSSEAIGNTAAKKHRASAIYGLAGGLIIAVAAVVAVWLLFGNSGASHPLDKAPSPKDKTAVRTAKIESATEEDRNVLKPSGVKRVAKKLTEDKDSLVPTPNLTSNSLVVTYGMVNGKSLYKKPIFHHKSENLISAVLNTRPGTRIIDVPLGSDFEQDFVNSLVDKIKIEEGDDEETIRQKQEMVDVKAELAARVKEGENLREIIENARKDLNKLADYRENLEHMYAAEREKVESEEELEALRMACNKLLEERGIPPIKAHKRGKWAVKNPYDAKQADPQTEDHNN